MGYQCICPPDYTGVYCEQQIDDCLPEPCPANFTCTDGVLNYTCGCGDLSWPCAVQPDTGLTKWQYALVGIFPSLTVVIVIGIIVGLCVRKHMADRKL